MASSKQETKDQRGPDGYPADPSAPLHPALAELVRLLARQAAREAKGAGQQKGGPHRVTARDPGAPLLTLEEAAKTLGISLKTLRRRIDKGVLPVVRDGRVVRVHPDDLQHFINARREVVRDE